MPVVEHVSFFSYSILGCPFAKASSLVLILTKVWAMLEEANFTSEATVDVFGEILVTDSDRGFWLAFINHEELVLSQIVTEGYLERRNKM